MVIKGEGSRGGHVIGHFGSGRAKYGAPRDVPASHPILKASAGIVGAAAVGALAIRMHATRPILPRGLGKLVRNIASQDRRAVLARKAMAAAKPIGKEAATVAGISVSAFPVTTVVGASYGAAAWETAHHHLQKDMKEGTHVNSKVAIQSHPEFKDVEVITDSSELAASKTLSDDEKDDFEDFVKKSIEKGTNAAAWKHPDTGKEYVFASKNIRQSILGHELGHIRDFRSGKIDQSHNKFISTISGRQVREEDSAWQNSPFKSKEDEPIRTDALGTYKSGRDAARITFGGAVAIGTLGTVALKFVK